jgi:hypothetical protein
MAIALTESAEPPAQLPSELLPEISGRSPWALAWRRLWRNRIAMAALGLFLLIIAVSFGAPLFANDVAHVNPFVNNLNGTTIVNGHRVPLLVQGGGLLKLGETPIGPTWDVSHYFLGADQQGRDVMARVLYGGRSSLEIGIGSALFCCVIATVKRAVDRAAAPGGYELVAADDHHRLHLPAICLPPDPRSRAVRRGEGVRPGGNRPGSL